MKLFEKNVLITGTSSKNGLGINLVKECLDRHYNIIATTRNIYSSTFDDIRRYSNLYIVELDIGNTDSVNSAFKNINKYFNKIDYLINNAVIRSDNTDAALGNIQEDLYMKAFNVNILGTLRVIQKSLPLLKNSNQPCIVDISSGYGRVNEMNDTKWLDYSISKAGIDMITKFVSNSLPNYNVFSVDPGWMRTSEIDKDAPNEPRTQAKIILDMCSTKQENVITRAWK